MSRFLTFEQAREIPPRLRLLVGDIMIFHSSGIKIRQNTTVVKFLGSYISSSVSESGSVIAPSGTPNRSVAIIVDEGKCELSVIFGSPWHESYLRILNIVSDRQVS